MNLTTKVPKAIQVYLEAAALTTIVAGRIYTAIRRDESTLENLEANLRQVPCVVIDCEQLTETFPNSGNYKGVSQISVISQAEDSLADEHQARCEEVFDKFVVDDLAAQLSAGLADFTVQFVYPGIKESTLRTKKLWVTSLALEIDCCASDLTP